VSSRPIVSVIINNYNYGEYLADAIESALNQTYPHVETIVVDDGSTDCSRDVIESFGNRITRVLKENGGQASALNTGFRASNGDIVFFLDSDDVLLDDIVERVVLAFDNNHELIKVQYRMREVDAAGVPTGAIVPPYRKRLLSGDLREYFARHHMYTWPWTSGNAYRSSVLSEIMPIPEDVFRYAADEFLAHASVMVAPILSLDEVGCLYRVHDRNDSVQNRLDLERIRIGLRRTYEAHPYLKEIADSRGLTGFPTSADEFHNLNLLVPQVTSFKLDRRNHPIPDDTALSLIRRTFSAVATNPEQRIRYRIANFIWAALCLIAPVRVARWLCDIRRTVAKES
jgi:glycosyltransferase involved in cell wall biosynthesis